MHSGIKVKSPITISNLNCGFDVLGMALNVDCDEIIGRRSDKPGLHLKLVGPNARVTPADPAKNSVTVAIDHMLKCLGASSFGMELEVKKHIKPGSGLGSSAAGACAGVVLANELLGRPYEKRDLMPFAILGEHAADGAWHADNVAPCLIGGMVMTRDLALLDIHRIPLPPGLFISIVIPHVQVMTKEARAVLSDQVRLKETIQQTANIAGVVQALHMGDLGLLARSLQDKIVTPQRASLQYRFYDVYDAAMSSGVMACGISGSGPAIFAMSDNEIIAEKAVEAMGKVYTSDKIEYSSWISPVNNEGTVKC